MLSSYPKIYNLGHAAIVDLFANHVLIDEKVDGSQFSFGVVDGEIVCRSKGKDQSPGQQDKMFDRAIETVVEIAPLLQPGWTYRGEYLQKPKHNTIAYDRVPERYIIIFDIDTGLESYLKFKDRKAEASRIGLECVPVLAAGRFDDYETFIKLLETESVLGGSTVEGVVIKGYGSFGRDKKTLMGKYVSEKFKERNQGTWKAKGSGKSIVQIIGDGLRTDARWQKAVQHLRDSGQLEDSPKDIGALIRELQNDTQEECYDEICAALFKWAWKDISKVFTKDFPAWYKDQLTKSQFGEDP